MESQNQPFNTTSNPNPTPPPAPNTAPVTPPSFTPPPVVPNPVYSSGTAATPSAGGGLMSILVGVVAVGVIAGGVWWWMGNEGNIGSSNSDLSDAGSYENPFGSGEAGSNLPSTGIEGGASGSVTQNGSSSVNSGAAQSCTSALSREVSTRDYYEYDASIPEEYVTHGTFKPTSSVSSKFSSSVQLPSGLKVVSKMYPEAGSQWSDAELYLLCATNINSVISFYSSYFGNANNWQLVKMITNGQGALRESWAAVSKTSPVGIYFGISNPTSLINEPFVTLTASYTSQ